MTLKDYGIIGLALSALAFLSKIRFILGFPIRLIISTKLMQQETAQLVLTYLTETWKSKALDQAEYWSILINVKPLGKLYRVFFEALNKNRQLFFKNKRPIYYNFEKRDFGAVYKFSYIKGTLDWTRFLEEVAAWEDAAKTSTRFKISLHAGLSRSARQVSVGEPKENTTVDAIGHKLLHWKNDDLGHEESITLEYMSLRPEMSEILDEVKFFLDSKEWFDGRKIPWRRGWLLHGKPGTGKTSFVRGLAAKFDLPVHVFDLSSMSNEVFRTRWTVSLTDAPCVVLIEDFDTIFNGRINTHSDSLLEGGMTFDCILNCIGGINKADGVLLFITSNRPETIDSALLRGGRLDRSVEVLGLDHDGVIKLAERILGNKEEAIHIANNPEFSNMTPAELQETLSQLAIHRYFKR